MNKPKCITTDEETDKLIERIGKEVLLANKVNVSHVIRYAVKIAAKQILMKD